MHIEYLESHFKPQNMPIKFFSHWTVGEIAVEHDENSVVLSQGFHQTYNDLLSTATWELPQVELDLSVYPNPTTS